MDVSVGSAVAFLGASGAAGWLGSVIMEMVKGRGARIAADRDADLKLEQHRDGLTFQLLEAARTEVSALQRQVSELRPLEGHLIHFSEALMHIERMLVVPASSENREQIEREARAFLNRMRRGQEATGTIANEVQRASSAVAVAEQTIREKK